MLANLTKGGINSATKALAIEYASKGIRVNAVSPGVIKTPMHSPDTHEFLSGHHSGAASAQGRGVRPLAARTGDGPGAHAAFPLRAVYREEQINSLLSICSRRRRSDMITTRAAVR